MTTTSKARTKTKNFDITKYIIKEEPKKEVITIEETGDSFEITVQPLSWAKRNQLLSRHLTFNAEGKTAFQADGYVRDALKDMVIDAPWGRTTESFLISIDARLGSALEKLVPIAFGQADENADKIKKG